MNDVTTPKMTPEMAQIETLTNKLAQAYNAVRKLSESNDQLTQGLHTGFAMAAMQGALSNSEGATSKESIASFSFDMADAMMAEFAKRNAPPQETAETIQAAQDFIKPEEH
jgi:hypothetical protein